MELSSLIAFSPSHRVRFSVLTGLLLVAAWTPAASAMSDFPGEIQKHLSMSDTPPCTLCHATPSGGGAVVTPFALNMVKAGLDPSNPSSVASALDKLEQHGTDSNQDGVPDIEQLRQGVDPSTGESLSGAEKYGCGARIAKGTVRRDSGVIVAAALLAMVFTARRRERREPVRTDSPR
jgi:hypothetical protein